MMARGIWRRPSRKIFAGSALKLKQMQSERQIERTNPESSWCYDPIKSPSNELAAPARGGKSGQLRNRDDR
jgi:hypothetical protein